MTIHTFTRSVAPAAMLAFALTAPALAHTLPIVVQTSSTSSTDVQAEVQKKLDKGKFKDVTVRMQGGDVVLGGTVNTFEDKRDADERVHRVKGIAGVDNEIQIGGPAVSDAELREQLAKKIAYDREGWRDNPFNDITLSVSNGVVTLGGTAALPYAKSSALSIARNQPGVKDVVDDITVAPVSPIDDSLRVALYRRIYGQPALNKYAVDPGKSIRILVVNGNVTLEGVVDSQQDKEIAGIQASGTPGTFKITNNLVVAGQQPGEK